MSRLFFKYYTDVTRYNLAFCIILCLVFRGDLFKSIAAFGTIGVLISFWAYRYFQNIEYYFYINKGLIKLILQLRTFIINFTICLLLLFFLWIIKIVLRSLSHSFGNRSILSNVEIECNTGEIVGILGRNGTGKSTLFKVLFGTLKPDNAEIYLDNILFKPHLHQGIYVGYHAQEVIMPKDAIVKSLISMYVEPEKQNSVFYAPGIHDIQHKSVRNLSLGQQRYLQLLLLLKQDHQFIILDEPFAMVEPLYNDMIKKILIEYKSQKGILISDHYYLDVLEISDRSCLMKDTKIIPVSKSNELIELQYLSENSLLF